MTLRMIWTTTVLRLLLTAGLLVGVYSETGMWTTLTIGLLASANELNFLVTR